MNKWILKEWILDDGEGRGKKKKNDREKEHNQEKKKNVMRQIDMWSRLQITKEKET